MSSRTVVLRQNGVARVNPPVLDVRVKQGRDVEVSLLKMALSNDGWLPGEGDQKAGIQIFSQNGTREHSPTTSPTKTDDPKDTVQSPKSYQIWKCCGEVLGSAEDVYRLMVDTAVMPRWNRDVTSYQVLEKIDEQTDVVQCISSASAKGSVSPRDFVILRRQTHPDIDTYVIADTGTNHPKATVFADGSVIRGWNGPGGIVIKRLPPIKQQSRCWVCWILNKDLRGWLPRTLVDQVLAGVLVDWIKNLRSATANFLSFFPPQTTISNISKNISTNSANPAVKAAVMTTQAIPCPN